MYIVALQLQIPLPIVADHGHRKAVHGVKERDCSPADRLPSQASGC